MTDIYIYLVFTNFDMFPHKGEEVIQNTVHLYHHVQPLQLILLHYYFDHVFFVLPTVDDLLLYPSCSCFRGLTECR